VSQVIIRANITWKTSPSSFHFYPRPTLFTTFLSPLPFFPLDFLFPSVCWLPLGFIDCTLCTSDVWVVGAVEPEVWLATVC
jgi:hypothetical protein